MRKTHFPFWWFPGWLTFLAVFPLFGESNKAATAEESVLFTVLPPSQVVIDGDTNIIRWSCRNPHVTGHLELLTSRQFIHEVYKRLTEEELSQEERDLPLPPEWIQRGQLSLRIRDLDCGNDGIERDLKKALKEEAHPEIGFTLQDIKAGGPLKGEGLRLHCTGSLKMAGVEQNLGVDLDVKKIPGDLYEVNTRLQIKMTDFIEAPPTALLGLVKVSNAVDVTFHLVLSDTLPAGEDRTIREGGE